MKQISSFLLFILQVNLFPFGESIYMYIHEKKDEPQKILGELK